VSRRLSALFVIFLFVPFSIAKDKHKPVLPDCALQAHMVLVSIDPDAEIPLNSPNANRTAQDEVEKALMRWGRFQLAMDARTADLVIWVRKGGGKMVSPTIAGVPQDRRPVIFQPTDGNIRVGGQAGVPPDMEPERPVSPPHLGSQIGGTVDSFDVFGGGGFDGCPASATPLWSYMAKDALNAPAVPAVEKFHKAIEEAEKEAAKAKKKQP
jgi:hypothetical protein